MKNKKQIRVVKIINTQYIVINAGLNDGIKESDMFQIVGKTGQEVFDPETKESLGTLDPIKATVEADKVYPKMTIVKSINTSTIDFSSTVYQTAISTLKQFPYTKEPEKLNVSDEEITGGFPSDSEPIKIGDIANPID